MFNTKTNISGFTLAEFLIVVVLLSMTSLTIFNAIMNGLRIWDRTQRFVIEQDIAIFLDKFSQETRNTFALSQFGFKGKTDSVEFSSMLKVAGDPRIYHNGEFVDQIGKVEYFFDPVTGSLNRRQANYSLAMNGNYFKERAMLSSIKSAKFSYFYPDESSRLIEVERGDSVPSAMKVEIGYYDSHGREKYMSKIIFLPVGIYARAFLLK